MELRGFADTLRRWWWLAAIPVLAAGVAAIPALPAATADGAGYSAVLHFTAAWQSGDAPPAESGLEDVWLASELAVHALGAWLRTESFRREISAAPAVEAADLTALAIASDNHRSIGQLFLNHPDAQALTRIAAAAAEVLQTRSREYFPQFGEGRAAVSLLDAPSIAPAPAPLGQRLAPFLRVALGLAAGLLLVMLAHALDPALRTRGQVEELGLPLLAALPRN